ncbi:MAG: D-alanine--poly(phosphoribitol) ligase subunit 2 [Planctomycetota bacterium]|jgi:acyl carrier protein
MSQITHDVKQFVLENFLPGEDPENLTSDTPLITGGILDSIGTLKLVVFIENQFGVTLEAHEASADHLDSLDAIESLVASKKAA